MITFTVGATVIIAFMWGAIAGVAWCDYQLGKTLKKIESKYGKINDEPE